MIPIDKLNYKKKYMENNLIDIKNEIEVSVATMGQDQRHDGESNKNDQAGFWEMDEGTNPLEVISHGVRI